MRGGSDVRAERIVVGIDEHDASDRAVDWLSVRRVVPGSRVELVAVDDGRDGRAAVLEAHLERSAERLTAAHPRIVTATSRRSGTPVRVLTDVAACADLLVIGNRRRQRVRTALGGWAPERIPTVATCPTVVVPEDWRPSQGDVVLGVDDDTGDAALRFAGAQAVREDRRLSLVRAWTDPTPAEVGMLSVLEDPELVEAHARAVLIDAERLLHIRFPDLPHRPVLEPGDPADVLERHARHASIVVLGRHHGTTLGGPFSGSTAHRLVTRSRTPVCIAPLRRPDPDRL